MSIYRLWSRYTSKLKGKTLSYISKVSGNNTPVSVPSWDQTFLEMAFLISKRSKDAQTQHGCVITDQENRVIGMGYNSFPKGMPDHLLPNTRPHTYKWMVHSERNALANCVVRPENGIAYVTGQPCQDCAMAMYQEGIRKFVLAKRHGSALLNEDDAACFDILTTVGKIDVKWVDFQESQQL